MAGAALVHVQIRHLTAVGTHHLHEFAHGPNPIASAIDRPGTSVSKDPYTSDLDGASIAVDYDQSWEDALFIIAHLFGDTVQWNTEPRAREIGTVPITNPTEKLLAEVRDYEKKACRYSLQLFHDAGVRDLDQWMADFAACDSAYLMHFYRTGEKRPFRSFWSSDLPQFEPLPIPRFTPGRWVSRADGVVL